MREIEESSAVLHKLARMFGTSPSFTSARGVPAPAPPPRAPPSRPPNRDRNADNDDDNDVDNDTDTDAEHTRAVIDRMPPVVQSAWDATQRALADYHSARTQAKDYVESFRNMAATSLVQAAMHQEREVTSEEWGVGWGGGGVVWDGMGMRDGMRLQGRQCVREHSVPLTSRNS